MVTKHTIAILLLLACTVLSGCLVMSRDLSATLDRTVVVTEEAAARAEEGRMSQDEMVKFLRLNADTWKKFRDARDGRPSK